MHPHVAKLVDLQKVDQQIAVATRDLDSLPAEEAKRLKRLEDLQRHAAERKVEEDRSSVRSREIDVSVRQADAELEKLDTRLNEVKNNAEYQATLFAIESAKADRDALQEEGLKVLEELDQFRALSEAAAKAVAEEEAVFAEFKGKASAIEAECDVAVAGLREQRAKLGEEIPPDLLESYTRLFKVRDNLAVCGVIGNICQGCYTSITTNDVARLMGAQSLVECGSCQRILFLES